MMLQLGKVGVAITHVDATEKVTNGLTPGESMADAIRDIASTCSRWAHQAIRISSTGEYRLKPNTDNPNYASFNREMLYDPGKSTEENADFFASYVNNIKLKIEGMRNDLKANVIAKKMGGMEVKRAVAQAAGEYLIHAIMTNSGNCTEKALLAGIFINATMAAELTQRGFTEDEISDAGISVTIEDNTFFYGDHAVCSLRHKIDRQSCELIVDPWMNGCVYDRHVNARGVYEEHLINPDESLYFRECESQTAVVNNDECIALVMGFAKEVLGAEPQFSALFNHYG